MTEKMIVPEIGAAWLDNGQLERGETEAANVASFGPKRNLS
jgi:hypothetical protein